MAPEWAVLLFHFFHELAGLAVLQDLGSPLGTGNPAFRAACDALHGRQLGATS